LQLPLAQNTAEESAIKGVGLLVPYASKERDSILKQSALLSRLCYRIGTAFSQLVGCYSKMDVWSRDLWRLMRRLVRKVLSHTVAGLLNHRVEAIQP
jgi:hypothetical protein